MKNEALCSSHYANSPQVAGGKTESVFSGFYVQKTVPGGADLRRSGDAWLAPRSGASVGDMHEMKRNENN